MVLIDLHSLDILVDTSLAELVQAIPRRLWLVVYSSADLA